MQERRETEERNEIDILDLLKAVLSKWWIILLSGAAIGLIAFGYCKFFVTPQYSSTTSMYILNTSADRGVTYADTQLSIQIMNDYFEIVTSRSVLDVTISELDLNMGAGTLKSKISLSNPDNTRVLYISVTDPDPNQAALIANTVRELSAEQIKKIVNVDAVNTVDEASIPRSPSSPNTSRTTVLGLLIGALAAIAVLVIIYLADNSVKDIDDVKRYLDLPVLANIPVFEESASSKKTKKRAEVKRVQGGK